MLPLTVAGAAVVVAGVVVGVLLAGASGPSRPASEPSGGAQGPPTIATLMATAVGPTEIDLRWPTATGQVVLYYVYRDGKLLTTEPPVTTTYMDTTVQPGHEYVYGIEASTPSGLKSSRVTISATSLPPPPLAAARLSGQYIIHTTFVSENFTNHHVGEKHDLGWQFTPICSSGACSVAVNLFAPHQSRLVLKRTGATYRGHGTAQIIMCGSTRITTTITISLHVTRGRFAAASVWQADAVAGTFSQFAPGNFTCQSGSSTESFTGSQQA